MIVIPSDISTNLPSIAAQEGIISASLNASMVQNVLAGIYTMIYGGMVYFHVTRKKPDLRVVVSATSVMYTLSMINFIIGWWWLDQWMVNDGATRTTMFLSLIGGPPPSVFVFNNFVFYLGFVASNALLLWRAYKLWDMSVRVIAVPSIGCLAQFCLLVASIALSSLAQRAQPPNISLTNKYNNLISGFIFLSLVTAVIPTALIAYKIHTTATGPKRTLFYASIMTMESGVVYSIMLIGLAVLSVLPGAYTLGSPILNATYYAQAVASVFTGMTPTVIFLSLSLKGAGPKGPKKIAGLPAAKSHVVSELRFGSAPGAGGRTNRDTSLSIQVISTDHDNSQSDVLAGRTEKSLYGIPESEKV